MRVELLEAAQQAAGLAVLGGRPGVFVSAHLAPGYEQDRFAVEGLLEMLREKLPEGDAVLRAERVDVGAYYDVLLLTLGVPA